MYGTKQDGGLSSVAYAPPRCNMHKQVSKQVKFQQHLIRYSRACNSYENFLDIGLLHTMKLLNQSLQSPLWLCWPLWNICVTNYHRYVPLVVNTSESFPHLRSITGFLTRLTGWVPLVEQELLTIPEHLNSPSLCVLGILISSISTIFLLDFGTVLTVWYFFVFHCIGAHHKICCSLS